MRILSIGRLSGEKGHKYGILAVTYFIKEGKEAEYIIIGEGEERKELEKIIKLNNMEERIRLIGYVSEKEKIEELRKADIFLLPSITGKRSIEGQSVAILEAQACEIPVIASDIGGIRYAMKDKKTGYLVPEKSVEEILEKLKVLENKNIRKKMGKEGKLFVKKYYELEELNDKLERTFKRLKNG